MKTPTRSAVAITLLILLVSCDKTPTGQSVVSSPSQTPEQISLAVHEQAPAVEGVVEVTPATLEAKELYLPTDRPIKTARTGNVSVPSTGSNCTSNTCKPTGCATCALLRVHLPLGAQVVAIRYYHTAQYTPSNPNDYAHPVQQGPGESAWAMMEGAAQYTTPQNVIVQTVYHNRSHNRARQAALEVDWQ